MEVLGGSAAGYGCGVREVSRSHALRDRPHPPVRIVIVMPFPQPSSLGPAVLALALACTPATPPPAPSTAPPPEPAPTVLTVTAPGSQTLDLRATRATHVDCSWGSSGVISTDAPPPYWVIAVVDLQTTRAATGLALAELELFDASARSLGKADRELALQLTASDATAFTGTDTTFDGTLTAGRSLRLRARARMEDAFADRVATPPATYLVTLHTDAGAIIRISGPVGTQWPTA